MSELPDTWTSTSLKTVANLVTGNTPSTKSPEYYGGNVPFVKPGDLNGADPITATEQQLTELGAQQSRLVRAGTTLVSCIGNLGKVGFAGVPLATNQQINSAEFHSEIVDDRYGYYLCKTLKPWMERESSATTIAILNKGKFGEAPFPLAPLAEQKRIADKLDTVLTGVDAVNTRLARVAPLLKRFRQSVLAAATSGRLTEDWRDTNPGTPEQAQVELNAVRSKHLGKLKVRGEAARVDDEKLFPIPPSWAWTLNHHLAKDDTNAICAGPFGTIFKAKDFRDSGVPIIFLRHVGEGRYMTHKPGFMDLNVWREHHQPYSVSGGELLVTKLGDPPGTACIYPNGIGAAMVTPDVLKMEVNEEAADTTYLMHFFNSPNSKQIIEELCFGVTRLRIDIAMFKTFPIPLPPRAEQTEIVRRVETLFAFADRLEARLAQAQTAATRLTPALLAKAFRGELVPQDPNDEPAAELLRRLAQAPAAASPRKGRKAAGAAV